MAPVCSILSLQQQHTLPLSPPEPTTVVVTAVFFLEVPAVPDLLEHTGEDPQTLDTTLEHPWPHPSRRSFF